MFTESSQETQVCASCGSGSINPLPGHSNSTDRRFFCSTVCEFSCPYDNLQNIQLLSMLPADDEDIELVDLVYGPVLKGSILLQCLYIRVYKIWRLVWK